ncbi:MAG TPA: phosphotransferase [Blastocatellia bacterium]|nr:phosphotransferase [Blastocatellia bacterium]
MDNKITTTTMQTGGLPEVTGDSSTEQVIAFTARYFGIPLPEVRFQPLTPDASTRKYYRVATAAKPDETFIISLYAAPFNPQENSYLDVTRLFEQAGLPVPRVIEVVGAEGIILQEDLGDCSLTQWLSEAEPTGADRMLRRAIELIVHIQAATPLAHELKSVASRLAFDEEKLSWELNYFFKHFFDSLRHQTFAPDREQAIKADLQAIAVELASRSQTLTHRDYHGMNLMVDSHGELRVIDHQDARIGPVTYDLVPLLVERRLQLPDDAWVETYQDYFHHLRSELRLPPIDLAELRSEFSLMTVQRQLKAIGTFSYQTAVVGRGEVYQKYIKPAVATVLHAMSQPGMKEYPALRAELENL